ncbi:MAG: NPCBM/NEW2 domain-containing protein [Planctomycetes bacterium]|nr:NPCBM/NEW2 domain-containing protein [Planctomycetota bacterium]
MPRLQAIVLALILVTDLAAQVDVHLADGRRLGGDLVELDPEAGLRLEREGGGNELIPLAEVCSIRFPEASVHRHDADSGLLRFELVGGDLLFGEVIDGDFDQVRLETDAGRVDLPLERLVWMRVLANAQGLARDPVSDLPADRDLLLVRSGEGLDQVVGEVARLAKSGVWFDWTGDAESLFSYRKDRVVGLRLAAPLELEPARGIQARVHFRDGSRLSGRVTRKKGGTLVLEHPIGFRLELDTGRVAAITFEGGHYRYLSDLEPAAFVETPYIEGGLRYGLRRDESLKGGPLTIGEVWFPKGLSVHSRSEIGYDLKAGDGFFSVSCGIDGRVADARVRGAVSFSVLIDDRVVFGPVVLRAGEPPRAVDKIALAGGHRLVLRADFADNHHFNGWAVWGSPVITSGAEGR